MDEGRDPESILGEILKGAEAAEAAVTAKKKAIADLRQALIVSLGQVDPELFERKT